jgi:hypothetical protein
MYQFSTAALTTYHKLTKRICKLTVEITTYVEEFLKYTFATNFEPKQKKSGL